MNPQRLLSAFANFSVRFREYPNWRIHNHGSDEIPHVIMVHDSVTGSMPDVRAAQFCQAGYPALPGPLYECLVGKDGTAHLIANGITYNAGKGDEARFMQAWRGLMPLAQELAAPDPGIYNGNIHSHAVAFVTYGAGPYTAEQIEGGARVCAAYAWAENWGRYGASSILGHNEFSPRKIDPALDIGRLRARVHALMTAG